MRLFDSHWMRRGPPVWLLLSCITISLRFVYGVMALLGTDVFCGRVPGLTGRQMEMCRTAPDAMVAVGDGVRLATAECQHQFRHHRWNCTAITNPASFGHVVIVGSREAAFTYAISSAGLVYAVTAACARGNISTCGCAVTNGRGARAEPTTGGFKWGGCSVDVDYGMRFARRFLDSRELEGDERTMMNLHNNKAGRKAVKMSLSKGCKCHGVSGSCTMQTCWKTLPSFRTIGDLLMKKYYRARPVAAHTPPHVIGVRHNRMEKSLTSNSGRHRSLSLQQQYAEAAQQDDPMYTVTSNGLSSSRMHLVLKKGKVPSAKAPKKSDLVFLQMSPNYCDKDLSAGSLGTIGRECNRTSRGTDGCDLMCCGRGYNTHQYSRVWQCRCSFHWCCSVNCDTCTENTEIYTCK